MSHVDVKTAAIGTVLPDIEFGPISRATLALYAGASGDHNPAHIDVDFAKQAGLPDVFAHGMLSFGALTRVVTEWAGIAALREFGARFVSITQVHASHAGRPSSSASRPQASSVRASPSWPWPRTDAKR